MKHEILLFISLLVVIPAIAFAQTKISGKITDTDGGILAGANVIIQGTAIGTFSDDIGNFQLETDKAPPFTLQISYAGFTSITIDINNSNVTGLVIALEEGVFLSDIIVSASRKREKIQEAPASVSVLSPSQLKVSPDIDPTRTLGTMAGVTIQQQSAGRINIEMRGANENFGTSVFPILDYRNLIAAGIGTFNSANVGISSIDIDRIEVVRGPGSALYGAGVTSGVVHYITKNPIDYPGTAIEVFGGNMNTYGFNARHATGFSILSC